MILVEPETITDATLNSSNVTEADYPVWAAATTYALADRVIVLSTHRIYESVQASNTGHDPTTDDGTWWLDVSATNRWKAFDYRVADQTSNADTITYSITPGAVVNGIAFFAHDGFELTVVATSAADGVVYNQTVDMTDTSGIQDWYGYFFEPIVRKSKHVVLDIPIYNDLTLDITINNTGGTAKIGQIVIGMQYLVGETEVSDDIGIIDYSTIEANAYGDLAIVERAYADEASIPVRISTSRMESVKGRVAAVRTQPVAVVGDELAERGLVMFGLVSMAATIESTNTTRAVMTVKGLV